MTNNHAACGTSALSLTCFRLRQAAVLAAVLAAASAGAQDYSNGFSHSSGTHSYTDSSNNFSKASSATKSSTRVSVTATSGSNSFTATSARAVKVETGAAVDVQAAQSNTFTSISSGSTQAVYVRSATFSAKAGSDNILTGKTAGLATLYGLSATLNAGNGNTVTGEKGISASNSKSSVDSSVTLTAGAGGNTVTGSNGFAVNSSGSSLTVRSDGGSNTFSGTKSYGVYFSSSSNYAGKTLDISATGDNTFTLRDVPQSGATSASSLLIGGSGVQAGISSQSGSNVFRSDGQGITASGSNSTVTITASKNNEVSSLQDAMAVGNTSGTDNVTVKLIAGSKNILTANPDSGKSENGLAALSGKVIFEAGQGNEFTGDDGIMALNSAEVSVTAHSGTNKFTVPDHQLSVTQAGIWANGGTVTVANESGDNIIDSTQGGTRAYGLYASAGSITVSAEGGRTQILSGSHNAVVADSSGSITVNGQQEIDSSALAVSAGADSKTVALNYSSQSSVSGGISAFRGGIVKIAPLASGGTLDIKGDITAYGTNAEGGTVTAELSPGSSLTGSADTGLLAGAAGSSAGTIGMTLGNAAKWNMTASSAVTSLSLDGSAVDLAYEAQDGDYRTLTADTLEGSGTFALRADVSADAADQLVIRSAASGSHKLLVAGTGSGTYPEAMSAFLVQEQPAAVAAGSTAAFSLANPGGAVDLGAYVYTLDERDAELDEGTAREWYLRRMENPVTPDNPDTPPVPVISPSAETVIALNGANSASALYWGDLEDLRKRLGDVR